MKHHTNRQYTSFCMQFSKLICQRGLHSFNEASINKKGMLPLLFCKYTMLYGGRLKKLMFGSRNVDAYCRLSQEFSTHETSYQN